ncbi:MAG: glycosyltransferase family 39 protein [Flavobacteriales bacterium]|nr:glycosyltransferase family 39 protein [Flavobacteriales bacterium]
MLVSHRNWITAGIMAVIAIAFHSYNLDYASYDLDEAVHVWHAQKSYSEVIDQSANDPNPPVYNLLMSAWVKIFGVDEWTVRFLSVLMGALSTVLMFLVVARNYSYRAGLMAALLFCFAAIQFRFTHLARPYSLLMVMVIASYGSLFEYFRTSQKRKLLLYYLFTALMIYIHPTSIFNLPAQGLLMLISYRKNVRQLIVVGMVSVASVATFAAYYLSIPYFEGKAGDMWFDAPGIEAVSSVIDVFYGNSLIGWIQVLLLIIIGCRFLWRPESVKWNYVVIGIVWFLLPIVSSVLFSHLVKPVFQDKYVLSAHPGLILLLAVSINKAFNGFWRIIPFAFVLVMSFLSVKTLPSSEGDWRKAVEFIKSDYDKNTCVFIHPWYEFRTFSYYFDRTAYTNPDETQKKLVKNRVYTAWHDVLPNGPYGSVNNIYLITSHGNFVDLPFRIDSLDKASYLIESKEFSGIRLRKHQRRKENTESDSSNLGVSDEQ